MTPPSDDPRRVTLTVAQAQRRQLPPVCWRTGRPADRWQTFRIVHQSVAWPLVLPRRGSGAVEVVARLVGVIVAVPSAFAIVLGVVAVAVRPEAAVGYVLTGVSLALLVAVLAGLGRLRPPRLRMADDRTAFELAGLHPAFVEAARATFDPALSDGDELLHRPRAGVTHLYERPTSSVGRPVSTRGRRIVLAAEDLRLGALPPVCVRTGRPADTWAVLTRPTRQYRERVRLSDVLYRPARVDRFILPIAPGQPLWVRVARRRWSFAVGAVVAGLLWAALVLAFSEHEVVEGLVLGTVVTGLVLRSFAGGLLEPAVPRLRWVSPTTVEIRRAHVRFVRACEQAGGARVK